MPPLPFRYRIGTWIAFWLLVVVAAMC